VTLIKTSLLNGVAVIIKMLTLLGINKVLAIYVGPAGYAATGQLQNAIQIITTFASGAINTGVTKYTAEYHDDEARQRLVWRTAGTIALTGSILSGIIIVTFNRYLAIWFLQDSSYGSVFIWFAVTLVLFTFNALLLAILNGKKEIARYVVANISGSIFALSMTVILTIWLGLYGALVALAVYQSLSFFVTIYLCHKAAWFNIRHFFGGIDKSTVINLSKFTAMALASAICIPLSHIFVRNYLGETLGWDASGHWEAMQRFSSAYLMLVTTTLSVYYLPRLSELSKPSEIKSEIIQGYKIILPITMIFGLIIFILRDYIITLLFTKDFSPMRQLFGWQILGDTIKIASWILAYLMLGKALVKMFIITEIAFSFSFVFLVMICCELTGFSGMAIAHAINYMIYFIVIFYLLRNHIL